MTESSAAETVSNDSLRNLKSERRKLSDLHYPVLPPISSGVTESSSRVMSAVSRQIVHEALQPRIYEFKPCLTYFLWKFDHLRGVTAFAGITMVLNFIGLVGALYGLMVHKEGDYFSLAQLIGTIGALVIGLLIHVLLFYGSWKKKKWLLLPWIFITFPSIFLFLALFIYFAQNLATKANENPTNDWFLLFASLLSIAVNIYLWSVVWSLYLRLGDNTDKMNHTQ